MPSKKPTSDLTCSFCKKDFKRESSLHIHMCVTKQRHLSKDEPTVRMAFQVWHRFYSVNTNTKKITWDDFIRNRYYNDFLKVGKYIVEVNAVNTPQFVDFLVRSGLPAAKWTHASVYETYIRELSKKETPDAAIERCLLLIHNWAGRTGEEWTDFFRKVSPSQATQWIIAGRLSPWVLYLSSSAPELFDRLSPEQLSMIQRQIDPEFWSIKLDRYKDEVSFFRKELDGAGL